MIRTSRILALGIALFTLSTIAAAQDRTPPSATDVAARGIAAMNDRATAAAAHLGRLAHAGVTRVNGAQADGNADAARRAARSVIEAINNTARNSADAIRQRSEQTLAALQRLNASDDLKRSVRTATRAALQQVQTAKDAALADVQAAVQD